MAVKRYLNETGLARFFNNLKSYFSGTATPTMNGVASVGSSNKLAHEDHVHPSDTSKVDLTYLEQNYLSEQAIEDYLDDNYYSKTEMDDQLSTNYLTASAADIRFATITDLAAANAKIGTIESDYIKSTTIDAAVADVGYLKANSADVNYVKVSKANITEAWIKDLLVQGSVIAQNGTFYELTGLHIDANDITAGTLTVDRLQLLGSDGLYYALNFNSMGETAFEQLSAAEQLACQKQLHADTIVAHSITTDQITANNLVGTGGWINLARGTFSYGDTVNGNGISWDGSNLIISSDSITMTSTGKTVAEEIANIPTVNLLPSIYQRGYQNPDTYDHNGITWTLNKDGSITATGTATANSNYWLTGATLTDSTGITVVTIDPNKKYTISGCPAGGSTSTYCLRARFYSEGAVPSTSTGTLVADVGDGYTISSARKYVFVYCSIISGYTCPSGGITFYPMLSVGTTKPPYQNTNNGTSALVTRMKSAEVKISDEAIVSTVKDSATFTEQANTPYINLVPSIYFRENTQGNPWTINGLTFTVNPNGSVTVTGTATSNRSYSLCGITLTNPAQVPVIAVDPTKKYTLSGCPAQDSNGISASNSTYRMFLDMYADESAVESNTYTRYYNATSEGTSDTGFKYANVAIYIYNGYACPTEGLTFYPMLEVGDTAHNYVSSRNGTNALSSRLYTAESNISQNANSIDLTVQSIGNTNLTPFPYARYEASGNPYLGNGITWTLNSDNSVTANGTSTAASWYGFTWNYNAAQTWGQYFLEAGTYTISGWPSGHETDGYLHIQFFSTNTGSSEKPGITPTKHGTAGAVYVNSARDTGEGVTFTIDEGYYARFECCISAGKTVTDLTVKPMLERGYYKHDYVNPALGARKLISEINMTPEAVTINANKINLNGAVTANNYFKINTDGSMETIKGKIGGWNIESTHLYYGTWGSENGLLLCPTGSSSSKDIGGSGSINGWTITSGSTFGVTKSGKLYAASGKIGPWTLTSAHLIYGTWGSDGGVLIRPGGNTSSKSIADSPALTTWGLTLGSKFGVTVNGELYANSADITGKITATSGSIAGWDILTSRIESDRTSESGGYRVGMQNISGATSAAFYAGTNTAAGGSIASESASNFYVRNDGYLYANNAKINGIITAASGSIGGFTIDTTKIYNGTTSMSDTTNNGVYIGTDGVNLGKGNFKVTNAGTLTAKSGTVGGWNINSTQIYKSTSVTTGTASTQYQLMLNAPASATTSSNALLVRHRSYDGSSYGSWVNDILLGYNGKLTATNADITGKITATSGSFKNGTIDSVTANNLTINSGSIDISTSSQTIDTIRLNYTNSSGYETMMDISPYRIRFWYDAIGSSSSALQAGLLTLSDFNSSGTLTSESYISGSGVIYAYKNSGSTRIEGSGISCGVITCSTVTSSGTITASKGGLNVNNDGTYTSGSNGIYCKGDIYAVGTITQGSDRRLKTDIQSIDKQKSAEFIYNLNPVIYKMVEGDRRTHHGFVAQDVEKEISQISGFANWGIVTTPNSEDKEQNQKYKSLAYTELIADLVATVQSLNDRIKALEMEV